MSGLRACSRRSFLAGLASLSAAPGAAWALGFAARRTDIVRIPLVYDASGTLLVAARLADRSAKRFVLDTGASRSAIAEAHARSIGLELAEDGGAVEGSAGVVRARSARAEVAVDGVEPPVVIDFTAYALAFGDPECVGILGAEFLRRAPFRILYRERVLEWSAAPPVATIPMSFENGIPRIDALVNGRTLSLRLDTGAALPPGEDAYVNVTEAEAARLELRGEPAAVFTATGTGGAVLKLPVHRLKSLAVAERELPRAFAIVQPRVGYFAREDAVGFLGNAVLDKLDPYFDYAGKRFGVADAR